MHFNSIYTNFIKIRFYFKKIVQINYTARPTRTRSNDAYVEHWSCTNQLHCPTRSNAAVHEFWWAARDRGLTTGRIGAGGPCCNLQEGRDKIPLGRFGWACRHKFNSIMTAGWGGKEASNLNKVLFGSQLFSEVPITLKRILLFYSIK